MSKIFKGFTLILLLCFLGLSCSSLSVRSSLPYRKSYSKNKALSSYRGPASLKTQEEFTPSSLPYRKSYSKNKALSSYRGPASLKTQEEFTPSSLPYRKSYSKNKALSSYRGPSSHKTQEEFSPLDLQDLDSTKPTVCSMTLNSKDEREVFRKHLGDTFNFVELVNPDDKEWLKKGCESQIQCDILVVSGHFGGFFFGSSGRISMEALENRSCQNSCKGLFRSPKEVFLFGSNTMAGKQPDSRTMQEYADILYTEHRDVYRTKLMAEEAAAYRYSPLGTQIQDRMKKIFKNARIYGFYSTAPSGKKISHRLDKYFKSIPKDYRSYLKKFPTEEKNTFWSKAMAGQHIRSANGAKNSENPICTLFGSQPIYKKLSWIDSVFTSQNVLAYAPNINEYLSSLEKRFGPDWEKNWSKEEVSYMERLQFHKRAKAKVGSFLEKPIKGLLAVQFNLLGLGLKLGWYDPSERKIIQRRLLGDLFSTNLILEQEELVCSIENIQMDLKLEDLPQEKWNSYTIIALGCVRPSNKEIYMALVQALTDTDRFVRSSAAWALGEIKPLNEEIHMALVQALTDTDWYVRENAEGALGQIKPKSLKVLSFITELLKHDNSYVRENAVWTLGLIKPKSLKVLSFITELLKHDNSYVRENAAWALGLIKPLDEEIHRALAQALTDTELYVRRNATWALELIKPKSLSVLEVIRTHNPSLYQRILAN